MNGSCRAIGVDEFGLLGRLGRFTATHSRSVFGIWVVLVLGLGLLAPRAETALSGAGWQAGGSESVSARHLVDRHFTGSGAYGLQVVVHSPLMSAADPVFRRTLGRAERVLEADQAVSTVAPPRSGLSISQDGHTAIIRGGAGADPDGMVAAADRLKPMLAASARPGVEVNLTGAAGVWSDFNEVNREAMLRAELFSWPVTLTILVLAFGSLVAAGLPLMLTIFALIASTGVLYLCTLLSPISIWAMNFALMFALALGIDYALFLVMRFRSALFSQGLEPLEAVTRTMDSAGKAVLFSGLTVVISLSAVMLVPSPAFRSTALGIILSALFVLVATLTLLPAVLARLGPRVNKLALPWVNGGEHRSERLARWAALLWRRPLLLGGFALTALVVLALPVLNLKTAMPSIKVLPAGEQSRVGYKQISEGFGVGAPGTLQVAVPQDGAPETLATLRSDPLIATTSPPRSGSGGFTLLEAISSVGPSSPAFGASVEQLRSELPPSALVGGPAVESYDLERSLKTNTPLVIAIVLVLGFLLLLLAFQAPLIAMVGVLTSLLSTAAAFGVAKLIFQDGHLSGLLGFEAQGFLNAWGPIYFFAMVFAISMDYTVFLLATMRERWEASGDAKDAMVGGIASSGQVIVAAGAVMVAVFLTFALSGPLAPKEMGVILGVAVLLDAFPVRLLVVPAALRVCGNAAWYLPTWLDRVLPEVRFGHGASAAS
jgi:putative drug exporter of the RND superfamily